MIAREGIILISKPDLRIRNIEHLDFAFVSEDEYVDYSGFGHAIIAKILES